MDRTIDSSGVNNIISINERKAISLSGVKKIESFDNEEFLLDTALGILHIKGEGLEMIKLDTLEGHVSIRGIINSLEYMDGRNQNKESNIFSKLFK